MKVAYVSQICNALPTQVNGHDIPEHSVFQGT